MKVLALTRYGAEGASSRVRFLQYLPALRAAGIDVEVRPLWSPAYLRRLYATGHRAPWAVGPRYARRALTLLKAAVAPPDVIWLEAELFPFLPALGERLLRAPVVVDYDDAVFHKYEHLPLLRGKIDGIIKGAAWVTAGSAYVAEHARKAGAGRVTVLPTVVDLAHYPLVAPPAAPPLRVGWIGTPQTVRYLDLLRRPLQQAAQMFPLEVVVVGASFSLEGVRVLERPWTEATEAHELASCHLGVMPLPDAPWERGKSGYKLIQAMACGRPVIASPVGVNSAIVDDSVGWLAADGDGWLRALQEANDGVQRDRRGVAARARVEERYALEVTAPQLAEGLRRAAHRRL